MWLLYVCVCERERDRVRKRHDLVTTGAIRTDVTEIGGVVCCMCVCLFVENTVYYDILTCC